MDRVKTFLMDAMRGELGYCAVQPPSIGRLVPVIDAAPSEHKKRAALPIS
jgi:hypothetical protein